MSATNERAGTEAEATAETVSASEVEAQPEEPESAIAEDSNESETDEATAGENAGTAGDETDGNGDNEGATAPSAEEPETTGTDGAPTLKIVITMRGDRSVVAIQRKDTDPQWNVVEGELDDLLEQIPDLLERADEKWADNPMRPSYVPPAAPAKKSTKGSTSKKATKKKGGKSKDRNAIPTSEHNAPKPPEAEVPKQQDTATTPRLF